MSFRIHHDDPPFHEDASGELRVGHSRVLLELVIGEFQDGATAEAIVQRYPSLSLADDYGVIAYYLRHPAEIDAWLARREEAASEVRRRVEANQRDLAGLRSRLHANRTARVGGASAAPAQ